MSGLIIPEARIGELEAYRASVINNPGWDKVANVFDTQLTGNRDSAIGRLSDAYWDARNGAMRQDAPLNTYVAEAIARRGDEGIALFYGGVHDLGLIGTRNLVQKVDTLVVPGAAVDANMMRALHAKNNNYGSQMAYIGNDRPLRDDEKARMQLYAPDASDVNTEADSLHAILEVMHPERELVEGDEHFKAYDTPHGRVYWVDAPKVESTSKYAHTRDTYRHLGKMVGSDLGKSAGIVTNDLYEFQTVDGHHVLKGVYGIEDIQKATFTPQAGATLVERAGFGPLEPKVRNAGIYAQELRSVHNSVKALGDTLVRSRMI